MRYGKSFQYDAGRVLANEEIVGVVQRWVDAVVVDLNLCPFARHELVNKRVRFVVTGAVREDQLLLALRSELELLNDDKSIETTLLIHPHVLKNFYDYNQFLDLADHLLADVRLVGVYQIASFHPEYQFAGTEPGDVENYTNRSPYPLLHVLREDSLERAIAAYPDVDKIPERNAALMNTLGKDKLRGLLEACLADSARK